MKVWKRTAPALILLCAVLSLLVCAEVFFRSWRFSSASSSSSRSVMGSTLKGQRRFRRSTEHKQPMISQYTALFESYTQGEIRELVSTLVERYSQSVHSGDDPKNGARMKRARVRKQPCTLKELEVTVSELGLGYISDEIVLFRYCSGTCDSAVRNYDLSLQSIRGKKKIKKEKVRARPCCRPLEYDDDVSFLDSKNRYHTIKEVSAKDCGCV
ncbi:neurturin [Rhinophrynus dorsalis]